MEAAGLVVGAVPLVVGALKAYRDVYGYLRTFRHYASDTKRLFHRLERQQGIFEGELDMIVEKASLHGHGAPLQSVSDLLAGLGPPPLPKNTALETSLRVLLGKHSNTFEDLLADITEQLQDLTSELKCFEALKAEQIQGEPLKQTVLRVKARIKIGVDKRRIQELIDALRSDNDDLRCISSYLVNGQKSSCLRAAVKTMPPGVLKNRAVTLALHDSLEACWTCIDPGHAEHVAKLCMRPLQGIHCGQNAEVRFDIAMACLPKACPASSQALVVDPIWLYVRTSTEVSAAPGQQVASNTCNASNPSTTGRALADYGSVCESLRKCECKGQSTEACLAYSQPGRGFRHLFYHHDTPPAPAKSSTRSVALAEILPDIRMELTMDQQLALSQRLVMSILELYQTPWLSEEWRIDDISTFTRPNPDDNFFIEQLHVTSSIRQAQTQGLASDTHWAVASQNTQPEASALLGITNSTLFSLGVALLEIAHGRRLDDCRQSSDPNLVCTAQRLAQRGCPLGERYRQLALQCLRCDFACGSELELRGLQDAVYTDVVGKLDELMAVLRA